MSKDLEDEELLGDLPFDEPNNINDPRGRIWKVGINGVTMKLTQKEHDKFEAICKHEELFCEEKFGGIYYEYYSYIHKNKFVIDYIKNEEEFDISEKFQKLVDYAVTIEEQIVEIIERKKENKEVLSQLNTKYHHEFYEMHGRKFPLDPLDIVEDYMDYEFQNIYNSEFDDFIKSKVDYVRSKTIDSIYELNFADCTKTKFYINEVLNKLNETPKPKRKKSSNSTNLGLLPTVLLFDLLIRENVILEHQSNCSEAIEILTGYSSKQSSNAFGKIKKPDIRKLHKEEVKKLLETILKKLEI